MASPRDTSIYFTSHDVSALASNIGASVHPRSDGSPWWVEPEPNQTRRRLFWRDEEVSTGFMATISIVGPGKKHPDDPISCHLIFDGPQSPQKQDVPERVLQAGNVVLPPGWMTSTDSVFAGGFAVATDDVRGTPALSVARLVVDILTAMGAPLPTGRWRSTESYLVYNDR